MPGRPGRALGRTGSCSRIARSHSEASASFDPVRPLAGEQLVEQDPQRVDVRGRGHRIAAHLFRGRVLRGHGPQPRARTFRSRFVSLHEDLGDSEVQQLHASRRVHQDVGGFEVTVHDQVAVGVLGGVAHLEEHAQPRRDAQALVVAVGRDGLALHPLHDEEGRPFLVDTAVEEPCDRVVLEAGQDLALLQEAPPRFLAVQAVLRDLDRDLLVELAVGALREMNGPHPAFAQLGQQAIGPDDAALRRGVRVIEGLDPLGEEGARPLDCRSGQERAGRRPRREQLFDLAAKGAIASARFVEAAGPCFGRQVQDAVQDGAQPLPTLALEVRVHGPFGISRGPSPASRGTGRREPSPSRAAPSAR